MKRPKGVTLLALFLIALGLNSLGNVAASLLEGLLFVDFGVFFLFIGLGLFRKKPAPRVLAKLSLLLAGFYTLWLGLMIFWAGNSVEISFLQWSLSNIDEKTAGIGTIVVNWAFIVWGLRTLSTPAARAFYGPVNPSRTISNPNPGHQTAQEPLK